MRPDAKPLQSQLATRGQSVSKEIFGLLLREITSGELLPGSRLQPERDLAAHFGVSQPTVREALRALSAIGLVDVRHGSGAYVTGDASVLMTMALSTLVHLESVSILDVLEIRSLLGTYSAQRAITHATEADVARIADLAERLAADLPPGSVDDIGQAIIDFQTAVSLASHSPFLHAFEVYIIKLMMELQIQAREWTVESLWQFSGSFIPNRAAIVTSLRDRDESALVEATAAYMSHQHATFVTDPGLSAARLAQASPGFGLPGH